MEISEVAMLHDMKWTYQQKKRLIILKIYGKEGS